MADNPRLSRSGAQAERATPFQTRRFWMVCAIFLLWALVICGRLVWLQVIKHQEYLDRAQRQHERTFEVAPHRGVLYDRGMRGLAMTVQADSIYAVPTEIADKQAASRALAAVVHTDPEDNSTSEAQIGMRLTTGHSFAWIARRVRPEVADAVRRMQMKGIYFHQEFSRSYPDNELAAQLLGYVGVDDNGLAGIERRFDQQLHGAPGTVYTAMDAKRHRMGSSETDPQPGRDLQLTIDENIQYLAERALDESEERTHAANSTVVVADVRTGQILALAMRPTFNPNLFRHASADLLHNHAVSDAYEPGSVFKLVTYAAAVEEKAVQPDDMIDCQGGQITLAGRVIHDDKSDRGLGRVTVTQALEKSSDVAAVKLALKVGQQKFVNYVKAFGFGARTGIELPGETRGLLRPVERWNGSSIGSVAIGQEVGVTPVQLVSMVSAIANGGVYLPPRLLMPGQLDARPLEPKAQPFKPGGELPDPLPEGAHRVISTLTAAQMRKMMEGVVLYGTGKSAQLNGYSAGGKTGTAQKIDPTTHLYSKTMHIASFAGFAPVNNPAIAVVVVVDTPQGAYYGADVAAPVFAAVAQQVLDYLGMAHDAPVRKIKTEARIDARDRNRTGEDGTTPMQN